METSTVVNQSQLAELIKLTLLDVLKNGTNQEKLEAARILLDNF